MARVYKTRDPMRTKTGKARLRNYNLSQLAVMHSKASRCKDRAKIQRQMAVLQRRGFVIKTVDAEIAPIV
jgi:hypothetical protein